MKGREERIREENTGKTDQNGWQRIKTDKKKI
jgi:hypothetical protein